MTQQNSPFHTSDSDPSARGNATIYVLILVALFAALGFVVSRQGDTSESSALTGQKADLVAGEILTYPAQVKQAIDMLTMSGVDPSDLNFTQPGQVNFNTAPTINKVFHPDGAGLSLATLPAQAVAESSNNPPAGWYLGMFNNIEWSTTTEPDVILVAYQISEDMCKRLNKKLTGAETIPVMTDTIPNLLIDKEYPAGNVIHSGTNDNLTVANCAACEGRPSLCVGDPGGTRYGFYSMIVNR